MKRVYVAADPVQANFVREVLAEEGIEATIWDERTFALQGAVPVKYPSVWVADEQFEAARTAVTEFEKTKKATPEDKSWICAKCGEEIDGAFGECWKCADIVVTEDSPERTGGDKFQAASVFLTTISLLCVLLFIGFVILGFYIYLTFKNVPG